ncbi:hypothetical protein CBR_g21779 [Chara braunii]|uniref:Transcription initiation factor IIE subunit beta n=1 Tax=Chara braunii TaxID=69332 RepID=A0A388JUF6_CHABU|nr:hypothetical protein CBR_g21779 [Chara braunii]|eukprot:GBG61434.1 hypothetical protein CBR_g21779 [Chara braunii]
MGSKLLQKQLQQFNSQQAAATKIVQKAAAERSAAVGSAAARAAYQSQLRPHQGGQYGEAATSSHSGTGKGPAAEVRRRPVLTDDAIKRIQSLPTGRHLKLVLDTLKEERRPLTPQQIKEYCGVDVNENKELFESLKNNPKARYDGHSFEYKSAYAVNNKDDLLRLIRTVPEGIPMADLEDSYPGIIEDAQELKAAGQAWLIQNSDSQKDIIYPNDPRIVIQVDEEIKQLVRSIEMPREFVTIERELEKIGSRPISNSLQRQAILGVPRHLQQKPKPRKKRENKRMKYTNFHLPELFRSIKMPD